jgi:hypothetical protein
MAFYAILIQLIDNPAPKAGERQPRDKLVNTPPPPVTLRLPALGLRRRAEVKDPGLRGWGITSVLLARNRHRISVPMAHVACMHVTVPADGRNKFVQYRY